MLLQPGAALIEQLAPAPEPVDQDALDQGPLDGSQQGQGADDLSKHTTAFDVRHQQAVGLEVLGQAQVGEVPPLQVHFHRTAGTLQHQPPFGPTLLQLAQPAADRLPTRTKPIAVVVLGAGGAHTATAMDHLTGAVATRFEQHGIHGATGLQSRGPSLHRL